jgi:16S rRNA (uracil1498-N3)-methyltransferase
MDVYRFYIPDLLTQVAQGRVPVRLPDDQAHHGRHVLRLAGGEEVVVFDGAGAWSEGVVTATGKRELMVALKGSVHKDDPPALRLTIATAVPKGERAEWLVEQASQLNVWRVQWLACERSVVKPREGGGKMDKWRRLAIESAKQCGRTHVMDVIEPRELDKALEKARGTILWLDPHAGQNIGEVLGPVVSGEVMALVGPEGGWSERESALLAGKADACQIARVRLTTTVLRIETACAAIGAVVMSGRR